MIHAPYEFKKTDENKRRNKRLKEEQGSVGNPLNEIQTIFEEKEKR